MKKNNQKRKINIDSIHCDVVHLNPNTTPGTEIKSFDAMEHLNSIIHLESNNNLKIRMRGDTINHAMNVTGTNGTDIRDGGPAVKIRWRLKLEMDKNNNQIRQGDKLLLREICIILKIRIINNIGSTIQMQDNIWDNKIPRLD
jgi:hypothetical protein